MNVVWPMTALGAGPFAVWAYFHYGRAGSRRAAARAKDTREPPPNQRQPFGVLVAKGTTHCGAGCMLGDIVAETFAADHVDPTVAACRRAGSRHRRICRGRDRGARSEGV